MPVMKNGTGGQNVQGKDEHEDVDVEYVREDGCTRSLGVRTLPRCTGRTLRWPAYQHSNFNPSRRVLSSEAEQVMAHAPWATMGATPRQGEFRTVLRMFGCKWVRVEVEVGARLPLDVLCKLLEDNTPNLSKSTPKQAEDAQDGLQDIEGRQTAWRRAKLGRQSVTRALPLSTRINVTLTGGQRPSPVTWGMRQGSVRSVHLIFAVSGRHRRCQFQGGKRGRLVMQGRVVVAKLAYIVVGQRSSSVTTALGIRLTFELAVQFELSASYSPPSVGVDEEVEEEVIEVVETSTSGPEGEDWVKATEKEGISRERWKRELEAIGVVRIVAPRNSYPNLEGRIVCDNVDVERTGGVKYGRRRREGSLAEINQRVLPREDVMMEEGRNGAAGPDTKKWGGKTPLSTGPEKNGYSRSPASNRVSNASALDGDAYQPKWDARRKSGWWLDPTRWKCRRLNGRLAERRKSAVTNRQLSHRGEMNLESEEGGNGNLLVVTLGASIRLSTDLPKDAQPPSEVGRIQPTEGFLRWGAQVWPKPKTGVLPPFERDHAQAPRQQFRRIDILAPYTLPDPSLPWSWTSTPDPTVQPPAVRQLHQSSTSSGTSTSPHLSADLEPIGSLSGNFVLLPTCNMASIRIVQRNLHAGLPTVSASTLGLVYVGAPQPVEGRPTPILRSMLPLALAEGSTRRALTKSSAFRRSVLQNSPEALGLPEQDVRHQVHRVWVYRSPKHSEVKGEQKEPIKRGSPPRYARGSIAVGLSMQALFGRRSSVTIWVCVESDIPQP
ncbi:hypothetical protein FA13DRAFT_1711107 [Coprinellus micaceus]|uniref:Uncharacterized protein n=1 Tax=Coprinellus micaceus TaxID=71717 RepID=A0A4Y7T5W0_COPMI|nr:hypothetical protein FA13DRAFT_1711107 [Coprinellus micaceus]